MKLSPQQIAEKEELEFNGHAFQGTINRLLPADQLTCNDTVIIFYKALENAITESLAKGCQKKFLPLCLGLAQNRLMLNHIETFLPEPEPETEQNNG